jgi:hypothetical protein
LQEELEEEDENVMSDDEFMTADAVYLERDLELQKVGQELYHQRPVQRV